MLGLAAIPAWPQAAGGLSEIYGTVHDASGATVPDAQVVIANDSKGVHLVLRTSGSGVFDAPGLVPAAGYEVTVDKQGFAKYDLKDITLAVGQNLNIVAPLAVAGTATTVQVEGEAPLVDDSKTDVSQVVTTAQIDDLPVNGRRYDNFALLGPGVTQDGTFGLLSFRGVANGNTFLLDGNDATQQFYLENNGGTRELSPIAQDSIQEFQVVTSDFSAEYGRANGGIINTVTRSGTNDLHGSLYWYYRNQDLMAHDPFANIIPNQWRLQSGASLGGAIIKNKLFYFFNGEFSRKNDPIVDSYVKANVINTATETWIGCTASAAQCAAINTLLPRFFGLVPRTVDQDLGFGRIDYHLNDKNTLSASLNFLHFVSPNGTQQTEVASTSGGGVNSNGNDYARVRNGKVSLISVIAPNLVNEFRYGINTDLLGDTLNPALNGQLGLLDASVDAVTLGAANYLPRVEPNETRNEFTDDLTWTKGQHILKFGANIATTNDYSYFVQNENGAYTYTTPTTFAEDFSGNTTGAKDWKSYVQDFGNPAINTRINDYDFFAQDQWKATSRLTINLGVRYEYSQMPQPSRCNPVFTETCHIHSPLNDPMPRVGLAYRLDNKTVLRAGFGTYYARVPAAMLQDLFTTGTGVVVSSISLSNTQAAQVAAGPVFPNILPGVPSGIATGSTSLQFVDSNWKTPYSENGMFAVDRELGRDTVLTASLIWNHGVQIYSTRDLNLPTQTTNFTYTIDNASGAQIGSYTTPVLLSTPGSANGRPNPNYGAIYEDDNGVTSKYLGATLQLTHRLAQGLQGTVAYTWSHEYDDGQGYGQDTSYFYGTSISGWLVPGNYKLDYADGLEDQPQRLVVSFVYSPTLSHRTDAFSRYFLNGWQLSSLTTINSSRPYGTPYVNLEDTPVTGMFSNDALNGYPTSGRVPFWSPDSVWQPASYRTDARLSKMIPIGERMRLYGMFEAFNLSNSWSPTSLSTQGFTEKGGVLTLTPNAYGVGTADGGPPDGSQARSMQWAVRFTF
jgi:hypothetical protein